MVREDFEQLSEDAIREYLEWGDLPNTVLNDMLLRFAAGVFRQGALYAWDVLAPDLYEQSQDASAYKRLSEELSERLSIAQKVIAQKNAERC